MIFTCGEYMDLVDASLAEVGYTHRCSIDYPYARTTPLEKPRQDGNPWIQLEYTYDENFARAQYKALCLARQVTNGGPVTVCFDCWFEKDTLLCEHMEVLV